MSRVILQCGIEDVQLVTPDALDARLVFRVYLGASQIAFARLDRGSPRDRERNRRQSDRNAPSVSYCLRTIVVLQNYRGYGIGSALLDVVLDHCRAHRVSLLYGEIRGDMAGLTRWYRGRGFHVVDGHEIRLRF